MFKASKVVPAYKNLLGWKQHYNTNEITLPATLTETETGEYYQQKHSALQLEVIKAVLPSDYPLDKYLEDVVTESTNEIFNDLLQYRQVKDFGKTLLEHSILLNKFGFRNDKIVNQGRFVGFQIRLKALTGLQAIIESIGLQFDGEESFKMYLFHSDKTEPLKEFDVTTSGNASWDWTSIQQEINAFNGLDYQGGVFVLGYYQDDVTSSAINYSNFDWNRGECGSCNSNYGLIWRNIKRFYQVYPVYVPAGSFVKGEMFDLDKAFYINDQSFGMNLNVSVRCDLTNFFIENRFAFKNLLAYKVTYKVLQMMKFSQQINYIEENLKMMIIRDLEGDVDTKLLNIPTLYNRELKSVSFNISGINAVCLNCKEDGFAPSIGVS